MRDQVGADSQAGAPSPRLPGAQPPCRGRPHPALSACVDQGAQGPGALASAPRRGTYVMMSPGAPAGPPLLLKPASAVAREC